MLPASHSHVTCDHTPPHLHSDAKKLFFSFLPFPFALSKKDTPNLRLTRILKLYFIIIGRNNHKSPERLKNYDSLENEKRSLNAEKIGGVSSILEQVPGYLFWNLEF